MPPPKRAAAANERSITLLKDVDPTELRMGIFGSFNAWPSGDQELIRLLFRVAARMHELTSRSSSFLPHRLEPCSQYTTSTIRAAHLSGKG
jgi:hypothetical protein